MAPPVVWAIMIGVGLGTALYYFLSNGSPPMTHGSSRRSEYDDGKSPPATNSNNVNCGEKGNPKATKGKNETSTITKGKNETCTICMYDIDEGIKQTIFCGHGFHRNCIQKWIKQDKNNTCPNCRIRITNRNTS